MDQLPIRESIARRPRRNGDEQDVFSNSRHYLACLVNHPGVVSKAKARYSRRTRREANQLLRTYR